MDLRPIAIQDFIDACRVLFMRPTIAPEAHVLATDVFRLLERCGEVRYVKHERFPACDCLSDVLQPYLTIDDPFGQVARSIKILEPHIGWSQRTTATNASANFLDGHANGMICGPEGIELRTDLRLGFTVMKPDVRYPDHGHPPEEAYVLLTPGEFRKDRGQWVAPGIGGGIHNVRGAIHAMRSDDHPFLAVWCLKV